MISLDDLDLAVSPARFVPLAARELGEAASDGDGFDVLFTGAAGSFAEGARGLVDMDLDLALVAPARDAVVQDTLAADTVQLGADLDTGAGVVRDFEGLLGVQPAATPPAGAAPAQSPPLGRAGGIFHPLRDERGGGAVPTVSDQFPDIPELHEQ